MISTELFTDLRMIMTSCLRLMRKRFGRTPKIGSCLTMDVDQRLMRRSAVVVNAEKLKEVDRWLRKLLIPET
jgi:hypothetical protein